ncbi:MAG: hypothetical protein RLZZ153_1696 [Pseudomonadota bacterium]|jgi:hypothetical protein
MNSPASGLRPGLASRASSTMTPDLNRMRGVLEQLIKHGHSLAIVAESEALLEAWGRALARSLRETPGVIVDLFMPASAEALLSRFNQVLADLPIERARAEPLPEQPLRVILVSDLAAFDTPEGALMARLVTDFPGANLRVLLLADRGSPEITERVFSSFGRRLKRVYLDQAGVSDSLSESAPRPEDLALRGERRSPHADASVMPDRTVRETDDRTTAARQFQPDIPIESAHSGGRGRPVRAWFAWLSVAIALLLISLLIVTLLHRDRTPAGGAPRAQVYEHGQTEALVPSAADWRRSHV